MPHTLGRPVLRSRLPVRAQNSCGAKPAPLLRTGSSAALRARGCVRVLPALCTLAQAAQCQMHAHSLSNTLFCKVAGYNASALLCHSLNRTATTYVHRLSQASSHSSFSGGTALRPSALRPRSGKSWSGPSIHGAVCRKGGKTIICAVLVRGLRCGVQAAVYCGATVGEKAGVKEEDQVCEVCAHWEQHCRNQVCQVFLEVPQGILLPVVASLLVPPYACVCVPCRNAGTFLSVWWTTYFSDQSTTYP